MKKTVDKAAVKKTAEKLMNDNGSTTTLDVKNTMRKDGYFAEQSVVSDHMRTLNSEEDWDYTSNGSFNTYSLPAVPTSSTTSTDVIDMIESLFNIHKYAMSDKSRLGEDLGLDKLQIVDLAMECERVHGFTLLINMNGNTTIGEIQKEIKDNQSGIAPTSAPKVARTRVVLDPKEDFDGKGADNQKITDLVTAGIIDDNDWILSTGGSRSRMIYDGSESRDHVRTAFARKISDRIQNTRTRRVKNVAR